MGKFLLLVSFFTLACAGWLAIMETVLRHPGYVARIGTALVIAAICVTTILVRMLHAGVRCERWSAFCRGVYSCDGCQWSPTLCAKNTQRMGHPKLC
jgi:hypothetical protein